MNTQEILDKITSRDTHKVWESSCEIISESQNFEEIFPLIDFLSIIREKTKNLDMGGALAPNQRFVDYAIIIIEFHKKKSACSCRLYLEEFELNDPNKEQKKGNVSIESQELGYWKK